MLAEILELLGERVAQLHLPLRVGARSREQRLEFRLEFRDVIASAGLRSQIRPVLPRLVISGPQSNHPVVIGLGFGESSDEPQHRGAIEQKLRIVGHQGDRLIVGQQGALRVAGMAQRGSHRVEQRGIPRHPDPRGT